MCVCVFMCVCMCIVSVCVCVRAHMHAYVCVHACMCAHVFVCFCVHVYPHGAHTISAVSVHREHSAGDVVWVVSCRAIQSVCLQESLQKPSLILLPMIALAL